MSDQRRAQDAWTRTIAVGVSVVSLVVSTSLGVALYGGNLLLVFPLALAHAAAIPLSLVRPGVAVAASLVASFALPIVASQGGSHAPWPWAVTTLITQALVTALLAYRVSWVLGAATLGASVALSGIAAVMVQPPHDPDLIAINLVLFSSVAGGALVAGIVLREWRVILSQLARERQVTSDERARRMVAEEKTRIARELHDVIAHSMSIINVQATSAPFRHPNVDAGLQGEFEDIAASSRRALAEMRSLLGVLRDDTVPRELAPQPMLSRIPELVAQSERSGMTIRLDWNGSRDDEGVAGLAGLAAYRIVQEALSNVIRHAPGATVDVRCDRGPDAISIDIVNTRPTTGPTQPAEPGQGLLGMHERATSLGGTVDFGPTPQGGYEVRARIPLNPVIEEEPT